MSGAVGEGGCKGEGVVGEGLITPYEWDNPNPNDPDPDELETSFNILNCLWFSIGTLMAQGCDILPSTTDRYSNLYLTVISSLAYCKSSALDHVTTEAGIECVVSTRAVSTRMLACIWWFFLLILNSSYTANLAAFLTTSRIEESINNAEDLASQTRVKVGALKDGATASFFANSNNTVYQKLSTMMKSRPDTMTSSNQEGVERVLKDIRGYAFFMESISIEYEMERNCSLMQINNLLDNKGYGIALPISKYRNSKTRFKVDAICSVMIENFSWSHNSPYRTFVSKAILELTERGILTKLKDKWWKVHDGTGCSAIIVKPSSDELDMANVGGVFLVVVLGCVAAFLVSLLEFLWNCRKIAVEEKITPWEAIVSEFKFAINLSLTNKPVRKKKKNGDGSESSSRSDSGFRL
uniref:Ionotropic glutamate receptor C-terminal domain-containing protein n=1 Tax=Timema cristinae TaxID=61476 RepID=A0A7R9CQZ8_TIMCR|nr:unnamed protein product [Timema cristinae]